MTKTIKIYLSRYSYFLAHKEEQGVIAQKMKDIELQLSAYPEINKNIELYIAERNLLFMGGQYRRMLGKPPVSLILPQADYSLFSDEEIKAIAVYEFIKTSPSLKFLKIIVLSSVMLAYVFFLYALIKNRLESIFAIEASVVLFLIIFTFMIFIFFQKIVGTFLIQRIADKRTLKITGDAHSYLAALEKISRQYKNDRPEDFFTPLWFKYRIMKVHRFIEDNFTFGNFIK